MKHRLWLRRVTRWTMIHTSRTVRLASAALALAALAGGLFLLPGQSPLDAAGRGITVTEYGPSGQLVDRADANTIHITFDRPMVAEDLPADTVAGPLRITPAVAGRFWWTGTRTLVFVADQPLPLATKFTVTLRAGAIRAFDGTPLYEDFTFNFTTPYLAVLRCATESPKDDMSSKEKIILVFSQPVTATDIKNNLTISGGGRALDGYTCRHPTRAEMEGDAAGYNYNYGSPWGELRGLLPGQVVIVEPTPAWPEKSSLRLRVGRGTAVSMREDFAWDGVVSPPLECLGLQDAPNSHPYDCVRLSFTSRVRAADVARALRFTPAVTIPDYIFRETRPVQEVIIPLELKPGATYRMELDNNSLRSIHNQPLTRSLRATLRVRDLPPRLELMDGHITLRPDQVGQLSVTTTNLDAVALRMAKVSPETLLGLKPCSWQVDRQWRLDPPRNTATRKLLPVGEVLPANTHGFVRVRLQEPRPPGEDRAPEPRDIFLQVTALGITGKFSPEGTLIWVTNLQGGSSVPGATVTIHTPGRGELWRGRTGPDGSVAAPGWNRWELGDTDNWETPRLLVIATKDRDQAVLASDWNQGVEAWRFPIEHQWRGTGRELRGTLFTDRGIYRPGETVRLKGIMRNTVAGGLVVPEPRRANLVIRDNEGNEAHKAAVTLSPRGGFDLSFTVPAAARLGEYSVTVQPVPRRPRRADREYYEDQISSYFRVAEFRAASIKAGVALPAARQYYGDAIDARISGRALAGSALANRAVIYSARLDVAPPRPAGWDGYSFSPAVLADGMESEEDGEDGDGSSMQLAGGDEQLDELGQVQVKVTPPVHGFGRGRTAPANMTDGLLTVEATVQDLGEQRSSARASVPVLRGDLLVGLRVPDAFKPEGVANRIEAIVLDRDGRKVPGRTVRWQVVRRTWINERRRNEGGRLWVSRAKDEIIASGSLESADQPVAWTVTPTTGGYYLVSATVEDARGRAIQAAQSFYAWGGGGSWWKENDDRVDLVPDRAIYRPGDTARLILRSPFTSCRALVTLEREGVTSQRVIDLVGTSPMIEIPLTAEHVPNVYVGIVIINTNPDFREGNPVRLGLVNLPVDPAERRLAISVTPDKAEYEPGGRVTLTLRARDAAGRAARGELTVAVVDEGVLQLIEHRFPDPLDAFFAQRQHHVTTADIRTHLVDDRTLGEKGEAVGGGGGDDAADLGAAAWTRRNFDPTAVWKPSVVLDANGEAKITFTLPDAITTYRVLVIANGDGDRFGVNNESTFLARRQLALEPACPRFVRPGDTFFAGVVARNLSAPGSEFDFTCTATGLEIVGSAATAATVERGRDKLVHWQYRIPASATGTVKLKFSARLRGGSTGDAIERVIPVIAPRLETTFATAGSLESSSVTEPLRLRRDAAPNAGGLDIQFSTTALVQLAGATEYLFTYPYGCLEQRTSCIAPIIALGDIAADLGLKGLPGGRDEVKKVVREYLQQVPLYQNPDGGFGLWLGGGHSYPYLTALTVRAMTRAKKQGYAPDQRCLEAAQSYLEAIIKGREERAILPYNERSWLATNALALAALAELDAVNAADLEPCYRQREQLPLVGVAALYQAALRQRDTGMQLQLRRLLLNALRLTSTTAYFAERNPDGLGWIYHSDVTATAAALEALLSGPQPFAHADKVARWLATERKSGRWGSTRENAAVCEALAAYYRRYEAAVPNIAAMLAVPGQTDWSGNFRGRSTEIRRVNYGMAALLAQATDDNLPVRLAARGPGRLYYEMRVSGVVPEVTALDRGFAIERRLEKLDGTPVAPANLKLSETYRLRCFVTNREHQLFVAADVPLPAGCEGVDLSLATEQQELARQLRPARSESWWSGFGRTEIRDDRIAFFADQLAPGRHEIVALVRVTGAGTFAWPAAHAEAMYAPEVCGRTAAATVTVAR